MDDRELDVVHARDAVHDLVDGSVSADGHDQARASNRGLVRELGQVLGPFGQERVPGQSAVGRAAGDLGPAFSGGASVGGRIDEEGGLANGRL
jgi:hypothetical protein